MAQPEFEIVYRNQLGSGIFRHSYCIEDLTRNLNLYRDLEYFRNYYYNQYSADSFYFYLSRREEDNRPVFSTPVVEIYKVHSQGRFYLFVVPLSEEIKVNYTYSGFQKKTD